MCAALENPARKSPDRIFATESRTKELTAKFGHQRAVQITENGEISRLAPAGAVHQGVLMRIAPPEPADLEDFPAEPGAVMLMLDQVTDPQNIGAIFRSAAAFGAKAVIMQDRNAPPLTGAITKAAAGGVDRVAQVRVVNLSRALEALSEAGWRTVGLDARGDHKLTEAFDGSATVVVLGSEGAGLRRLVSEHCDVLAKISMPGDFESLNVSAATAIALHEATRLKG